MKKLLLTFIGACLPLIATAQTNDECSSALTIPVNETVTCYQNAAGSFTGATPSNDAAACWLAGNDVWLQFVPTAENHILVVDSGTAHGFAYYTGSCGSLTEVGCGTVGPNAALTGLSIGQTYTIRLYASNPSDADFTACLVTPLSFIDVDNTTYTPEELVTDVLIDTPCLTVSGISGTTATGFNGLAYFEKGFSVFPFEKGIVLSTGNTDNLVTEIFTSSSDNGGEADEDINDILVENGYSPMSYNAAVLEFDFVPVIDYISFDYIFASNEYGTFQCFYGDTFAFLLTDTTTGVTTNLAMLPGTDIPVSVVTVNDDIYNPGCESQNPEYFGDFYGANNPIAPVHIMGATVPLTAESAVVPGHTYNIKLVIADYGDAAFDSAVFIDAGSFNLGNPDADYITMEASNGNLLCNGASTTLNINLEGDFTFEWKKDDVTVENETTNELTVDEGGVYTLTVAVNGLSGCTVEYSINVFAGDLGLAEIEVDDYLAFEPSAIMDGLDTFDLNTKTEEINASTGTDDYVITYHLTQADADMNINPLPLSYTNIDNPQEIHVRIANGNGSCFVTTSFNLVVLDEGYNTPAPVAPPSFIFEEGDTLADIPVEGESIEWYDNPGEPTGPPNGMDGDTPLPMDTMLVDGTTYYATQTLWGIESLERTPVTVHSTLGIEGTAFNGLMTYPNPVSNVLTISNSNAIDTVTVYNLLGQVVVQTAPAATEISLDLSGLAGGVYMVKINSGNKERTIRVIKE